jgi:serine/threonine protein kinase
MLNQVPFTSALSSRVRQAFMALHDKGVLHGDVRPENILVTKDSSVVIIDFERSEVNIEPSLLEAEQNEVRGLLRWWKQGFC